MTEEARKVQTEILRIKNPQKQTEEIQKAAEIIKKGGLVAFPTETVYGLGANGLDATAAAGIYEAKGRPSDNPLILHVANEEMLPLAVKEITPLAQKLISAFCPGPITVILPKADNVPEKVTGGLQTVGVRMPNNPVARALIAASGVPIAAPSANISGRPSPTTAEMVALDLAGKIPCILDGGECHFGVESTIVDCTGEVPVILRPGAITKEMIEAVAGRVELDQALLGTKDKPKAPGMKYTHYAPNAPLTVVEGEAAKMSAAFVAGVKMMLAKGQTPGLIVSAETAAAVKGLLPKDHVFVYGKRGDLLKIAASLYQGLRVFDNKPCDILLAEGTTSEDLGLAIMNRLHKASGFRSYYVK